MYFHFFFHFSCNTSEISAVSDWKKREQRTLCIFIVTPFDSHHSYTVLSSVRYHPDLIRQADRSLQPCLAELLSYSGLSASFYYLSPFIYFFCLYLWYRLLFLCISSCLHYQKAIYLSRGVLYVAPCSLVQHYACICMSFLCKGSLLFIMTLDHHFWVAEVKLIEMDLNRSMVIYCLHFKLGLFSPNSTTYS